MKMSRLFLLLAAGATLLFTSSCAQQPDPEKDPSADAAYKRDHRPELYREAQRSDVNYL